MPEQSHTILSVTGQHGSGKSWTSKLIAALVDPSSGAFAGPPSNRRDWISHAVASWVIGQENLSHIEPWLSDAYCRASTRDARRDRKLFTDADVDIQAFLRVLVINGISFGKIAGDLADRVLRLDLPVPDDYIEEEQLEADWREAYPGILGGLYTHIAAVLKALPGVKVERPPRMADFARVLAAVDRIMGTDGLKLYRALRSRLDLEIIENDLVAQCLLRVMAGKDKLEGSAIQWLTMLSSEVQVLLSTDRVPTDMKVWPQTGQGMSSWLKRLAPSMVAAKFKVSYWERTRHDERSLWVVERLPGG